MIATVIERIPVHGETDGPGDRSQSKTAVNEEDYGKLLRRLRRQIRRAGITPDEVVRAHPGPVNAILLLKSTERVRQKESSSLEKRLGQVGFRHLQNGVWLLPPSKKPSNVIEEDDLKLWVHRNITKPLGKDVQFVLPFVAVVDLKKVVAERRGIRKLPYSRTIFNLLELEEAVPAAHAYQIMKDRGLGIEDIIASGDLLFILSSFCEESELAAIDDSYKVVVQKLQRVIGSRQLSLEILANLDPKMLAYVFEDLVAHPNDTAQRTIIEAQFWMRFLRRPEETQSG